ncbi:MAG: ketopantoate reductase family protein [Hyphomicrobiaceae bacterium]
MKIAIVGAGAMGSIYAGLMADTGQHEVWAVDVWQDHLDAIAGQGLRVEGASGDRVVKGINVTADASAVGPCDLVILAVKANHVPAAVQAARSIVGGDTLVLAMQNGLGSGERVLKELPGANILLGVAEAFGASMKGPGHVHHTSMKLIRLGEIEGGLTERVETIADVWRGAGFEAKAFADINQLIWDKFVCNVSFSAPCTIFNRTVAEMRRNPESWRVSLNCGLEAWEVGCARGINFSFDDPVAHITAFAERLGDARPSMLLDHMERRHSEIDVINGMVPVLADELEMSAPYNDVVTAIVRAREKEFGRT